MKAFQKLLLANKSWAAEQQEEDPTFFTKMAEGQKPEFLWIGCADSRAPADRITGTEPGHIFVHRNVANLVLHTDFNMLSVLQYAVEVLKVKHIMVVGHYGCGGVKAAMTNDDLGLINKWIRNIKDVYEKNHDELEAIKDDEKRTDRLCELNVLAQVDSLLKTTIIQKSWKSTDYPSVHGCILELTSGRIRQLIQVEPKDLSSIPNIYKYEV
ncbi:MAG: carbonic anhydrase [Spirosomataceae bacterium]|jgi:carbonic anhydrase